MHQTSQRTAWFDRVSQDWHYALRTLRRNAAFSGIAVLSLGFGIGATTTVFSAIDAFHFRPLPFSNADRLVWVAEVTPHDFDGCPRCPFLTSPSTVREWAEQMGSFEAVAAIRSTQFRWEYGHVIESLKARQASQDFFEILGVRPLLGRGFTPADAVVGADPVALLSYDFWRTKLAADSRILGSRLSAGSRDVTIIGILPHDFRFKDDTLIWTPLTIDASASRSSRSLTVIARLRDGSSLGAASAEMEALWSRLARAYPAAYRDWGVTVQPLRDLLTMGRGRNRFAVLAFTMLVLFIGVLNVSGLMLSRAVTRRREFAMRSALGGSRAQLVRQLLVEGTCIGLAGGAVGVVLAYAMLPFVPVWFTTDATGLDVGLNHRVLIFAVAIAILAGICTGVAPAIHAARADLSGALRERSPGATAHAAGARDALAALQIAVGLVLLTAAALFSRDFLEVRYLDLGYDPKGLYFTSLAASPEQSRDPAAWGEIASVARERVAAIPGVASASLEHRSAERPRIVRPDGGMASSSASVTPAVKAIDPAYFTTFGTRLLAGRAFTAGDDRGNPPLAIVNAAAAKRFWPGRDPIGRQVFLGDSASAGEWLTVAGVVEDAERGELRERHWPMVYRPFAQARIYHAAAGLYVRMANPRPETLAAVQAAIRITGRRPAPLKSEESRVNELFLQRQLNAIAFDLFAGFGLFLAAMGIYASVAYGATRRTHEIGIRMALGATRWSIVALLARRQVLFALGGVIVGMAGVFALMRILESFLLGISGTNPWLLGGAGLLIICVAFAATCLPALRATRVDGAIALRAE